MSEPAPERQPRSMSPGRLVVLAACLLLLGGVVVWAAKDAMSESAIRADPAADLDFASPPEGSPAVGQVVESRVVSDREVRVSHWILSSDPIDAVTVRADQADGAPGTLAARNVQVYADGRLLDRLPFVSSTEERIALGTSVDQVHLTYDMVSRMEDGTVDDRVLARVTSLSIDYAGETGPVRRIVTAPGPVLNVACLRRDDSPPRPCGRAIDDGGWQVDLDGVDRDNGLLVQLQLTS